MDSLRRIPFAPGDADALVAFCDANGGTHDTRLLLRLTSGEEGVVVVGDDDGTRLAAIVVDRIRNGADAANLETIGVRAPLPADAYIRLVVEPSVAFVRSGERRALHVIVPPAPTPAAGAEAALRDAGFSHLYDTYEMRRPQSAPLPEAPAPLPGGWSWVVVDEARAEEAHAALVEMFRDALATSVMPLADFRAAVASGAAVWRALLDGERIAGVVRVLAHGARGELRILGRAPAYRGRGLGPRLVGEGLRLLREAGAGDVDLSVEVANESALSLYLRFGFEVVTRTPVFGLALR
jgi:ribosomal protein S18 acetylase RimI-like enzyme